MKTGKLTLLTFFCGGMEISWRYAWVLFLSLLIVDRPFPLPESLAAFVMAFCITRFTQHRCRRVYQSLIVHLLGFTVAWLITAYGLFYSQMPFLSMAWIQAIVGQLHDQQGLIQLPLIACLLLIWLGARAMAHRQVAYDRVCFQFDKGLGALFLLLLIRWIAEAKGGVFLEDPVTRYLLFAYVMFSLIAISLSRDQSTVQKTYRPGFQGVGIVLGFVGIVSIGAAVLTGMGLPHLTLMADSAQGVLKDTTAPMGPVMVNILRFLFSIGRQRRLAAEPLSTGAEGSDLPSFPPAGRDVGIGWVTAGLIGLLILGIAVYLVYVLVRWLSRSRPGNHPHRPSIGLIGWLFAMAALVWIGLKNAIRSLFKRIDNAATVYADVLRWGRRSGLPTLSGETPLEYGRRLARHFPHLEKEIEIIIEAFNEEVYGKIETDDERIGRLLSARGSLRRPRHWPARIRVWFAR